MSKVVATRSLRVHKHGFRIWIEALERRRLLSGALDPTFGVGGVVKTDVYPGKEELVQAVVGTPDGGAIVVGNPMGHSLSFLVHYNADGTLDKTFGDGGQLLFHPTVDGRSIGHIALDEQGRIVVSGSLAVGEDQTVGLVGRFNPDGSVDTTFGTDGWTTVPLGPAEMYGGALGQVVIAPDGSIVATGRQYLVELTPFRQVVVRLTPDGTLDSSFDGDGILLLENLGGIETTLGVGPLIDAQGRIVLAGGYWDRHPTGWMVNTSTLIRLLPDGQFDASFGTGGVFTSKFGADSASFGAMALDAEGRVLVTSYRTSLVAENTYHTTLGMMRFGDNGAIDSTFGTDGFAVVSDGPHNGTMFYWGEVAVDDAGRVVLGGNEQTNGQGIFAVGRLTPDGALDPTFGDQGILRLGSAGSGIATAASLAADGSLLLAGYSFVNDETVLTLVRADPSAGAVSVPSEPVPMEPMPESPAEELPGAEPPVALPVVPTEPGETAEPERGIELIDGPLSGAGRDADVPAPAPVQPPESPEALPERAALALLAPAADDPVLDHIDDASPAVALLS